MNSMSDLLVPEIHFVSFVEGFGFIRAPCLKTVLLGHEKKKKMKWQFKKKFPCVSPTDGERIAHTTLIDALLEKDFQLVINNTVYNVCSPQKGTATRLSHLSHSCN